MCSRYEINRTSAEIALRFDVPSGIDFLPLAEIRPTNRVPVITADTQITLLRWGLKVDWDSQPLINARSETLTEKPTFQPLLENRCLVPATAYFEWRKEGKLKIKTRIQPNHGEVVSFAGLVDGDHFTLITCAPSPSIQHIHSRMPVILNAKDENAWLASANSYADVAQLLVPYSEEPITFEEVAKPTGDENKQGDLFK